MKKRAYAGNPSHSRTRWWEEGDLTPEEWAELDNGRPPAVMFEGDLVADYNFFGLTDEQQYDPAFDAVVRADYNSPPWTNKHGKGSKRDPFGKVQALCDFIRDNPLTPWGRNVVADFIYRNVIRQRRPIYEPLSRADLTLSRAKLAVRKLREEGIAKGKAIAQVAKSESIPLTTLENAVNEKRASTRRARKGVRGAASPRPSRARPAMK